MKIKKLFAALFVMFLMLIAAEASFAQKDSLQAGEALARGEMLVSKNGYYKLTMQDDGNLVLYRLRQKRIPFKALWNSGTVGLSVKKAAMQKDGNFVLYNYSDKPVWNSKTSHVKNIDSRLVLQDDGNLVIYRPNDTVVWNTQTFAGP